MTLPYQKVHVVINPASGQNEPILNVLNTLEIHRTTAPDHADDIVSLTKQELCQI